MKISNLLIIQSNYKDNKNKNLQVIHFYLIRLFQHFSRTVFHSMLYHIIIFLVVIVHIIKRLFQIIFLISQSFHYHFWQSFQFFFHSIFQFMTDQIITNVPLIFFLHFSPWNVLLLKGILMINHDQKKNVVFLKILIIFPKIPNPQNYNSLRLLLIPLFYFPQFQFNLLFN